MPFKHLLTLLAMAGSIHSFSQTYYVAVGGTPVLSTIESTPGDIEFAFNNASSGSTVYIKQGNYGALNLDVANDSVEFIGYTSTPGDIDATDVPDYDSFDPVLLESTFPMIDGIDQATAGTGIYSGSNSYVLIKNFYVRNYNQGFTMTGTYNTIENCVANDFGDKFNSYNGTGYNLYGNFNTLENCFLLNAGAQGMTSKGNDCLIQNCQVYCDDTISYAPTDYYILVTANSSTSEARNNLVNNCTIERIYNVGHTGHGFCLTTFYIHEACSSGGGYCYNPIYADDSVVNNVIQNSTATNIGELVLLRGPGVRNNDLINLTSTTFGGFSVTAGASFNTFTNCNVRDTYYYDNPSSSSVAFTAGVEFFAHGWGDTTDLNVSYSAQGTYPWQQAVCAEGNVFRNCLFENVSAGIMHSSYSEHYDPSGTPVDRIDRKIVKDNKFVNCTFIGRQDSVDALFYAMRGSVGNEMINCIVHGFNYWEGRYFPTSSSSSVLESHNIIPSNYKYNHCNFYGNTFDALLVEDGIIPGPASPVMVGYNDSISGEFIDCNFDDPGFVDPLSDYHIQDIASSGAKDRGLSITEMAAEGYGSLTFDYDDLFRPCNDVYDVGAFEYQDCSIIGLNEKGSFLKIYPNPTSNFITIEGADIEEIMVYDLIGNLMSVHAVNSTKTKIELPQTAGVYILTIRENSNFVISEKIIRR